jgi:hypothetical protein
MFCVIYEGLFKFGLHDHPFIVQPRK